MRILLVDGNEDIDALVQSLQRSFNGAEICIEGHHAAAAAVREQRPDLLLVDMYGSGFRGENLEGIETMIEVSRSGYSGRAAMLINDYSCTPPLPPVLENVHMMERRLLVHCANSLVSYFRRAQE